MKKQLLLSALIILFSLNVSARNSNSEYENPHIISFGIGYGNIFYYTDWGLAVSSPYLDVKSYRTPDFTIGYRQLLKKHLGPGYLGFGARFSYEHGQQKWIYKNSGVPDYTDLYDWNSYGFQLRAEYHYIIPNHTRIEVYAGPLFEHTLCTEKITFGSFPLTIKTKFPINFPGGEAGACFKLTNNFSLFGEVSYPYNWISAGLNFKF